MTEYICPKRATYIANMSLEMYRPIAAVSRQRQCQTDVKGSYKRLITWAVQHASSKSDEGVTFHYRFAAGKDFGRMTSSSVQGIPRDIRGFVCISEDTKCATMTDLDMDNAHPTILLWLCHNHGLACSALTEYVNNRDHHMDELRECTGKTRDEVKSMFLASLNSEAEMNAGSSTEFFKRFDIECTAIQQAFMQLAEYRWVLPHAQRSANDKLDKRKEERRHNRKSVNGLTANVGGCFLNLILCTWENRFNGIACKTLIAMEYEVSANMFDGFMIKGDHYPEGNASKLRDSKICPEIEQALFQAHGIRIAWSMKRHASPLTFCDDEIKLPYAKHAEPFLEKVVRVGSEYLLKLADDTVVIEGGAKLAERFKAETAKCMLKTKDGTLIKSWYGHTFAETLCRDPAMRSYEKMDMYPDLSECPPEVYNLYTPMPCDAWDVARADPHSEHVAAFRKLIRYLSDLDESVATFIELFMAHTIQFPSRKPGAWLVLMSEEGAGKGTLVRMMALLIGASKVRPISNVKRSLLGEFNGVMLDAFLVVLDEAGGKDMFELQDELKHMITDPTLEINQKGINHLTIRSYARFMLTCQPRSVPTKKGDRRGVISRCSDDLIGNDAYFKDINMRMGNEQAIRDLHAYLMTLAPPPVFTIEHLPQTEVQKAMQAANADIFDAWMNDVVESWITLDGIYTSPSGCSMVPSHASSGDYLVDYLGERDPTCLKPEFDINDLFRNFKRYAERSNASKLIEGMTVPKFVARFATCRWRKLLGTPVTHKLGGVRHQCRMFDMVGLAIDMNLSIDAPPECAPEVQVVPPRAAIMASKRPVESVDAPAAGPSPKRLPVPKCVDCGLWSKCDDCSIRDFNGRRG